MEETPERIMRPGTGRKSMKAITGETGWMKRIGTDQRGSREIRFLRMRFNAPEIHDPIEKTRTAAIGGADKELGQF